MNDPIHNLLNIEPTEPFSDNFEQLGFESRYMLNNMGTMIFFILAYPILWIIQKVLLSCKKCSRRIQTPHRKLKRALYYAMPITLMLESYSILTLCCLIAVPVISFDSVGLAV